MSLGYEKMLESKLEKDDEAAAKGFVLSIDSALIAVLRRSIAHSYQIIARHRAINSINTNGQIPVLELVKDRVGVFSTSLRHEIRDFINDNTYLKAANGYYSTFRVPVNDLVRFLQELANKDVWSDIAVISKMYRNTSKFAYLFHLKDFCWTMSERKWTSMIKEACSSLGLKIDNEKEEWEMVPNSLGCDDDCEDLIASLKSTIFQMELSVSRMRNINNASHVVLREFDSLFSNSDQQQENSDVSTEHPRLTDKHRSDITDQAYGMH